jgi:Domain of unknown function (DUF6438)
MFTSFNIRLICVFLALAITCPAFHAAPNGPIPADTVIVLQSGYCELNCPIYRVVVFADGSVIWQGIDNVRRTGVLLKHITLDQVRELIDAFQAVNFMHLQNIYGFHGKGCSNTLNLMGAPVVSITLVLNGTSNFIEHNRRCTGDISSQLSTLESNFAKILGTQQWIK